MRFPVQTLLLFLTIGFFQISAHAQISLPKAFGDSMVLQRGVKIPVWGMQSPMY